MSGNWTSDDKLESSTWRELECARQVLCTYESVNLRRNVEAASVESGVLENCNIYNLAGRRTTFLVDSRIENTCKKYYSSFNRWTNSAIENSLNELPVEPVHIALYITKLIDEQCSPSVVNSAVYSIKWAHDINGFNDPTENSFVKYPLESAKRRNGRPVNKKDPVNNDMLIDLCSMYTDSSDLLIVRDLTMILLSYSGFLRFDEISKLRCKDVSIFKDHLKLSFLIAKQTNTDKGMKFLFLKILLSLVQLTCIYDICF
ncbi:Hypothetical predicted protein [Mytilus galloprovincialis]|uniref:Tyr recombinase domain-containing protein n=1 Tax=Mytilus galloprovincialis TaxID=29158 RepID=A0A8B6DTJ1_MYTGA|nr:Hypothetical predicted protein [Mytilus galloprovincialis]